MCSSKPFANSLLDQRNSHRHSSRRMSESSLKDPFNGKSVLLGGHGVHFDTAQRLLVLQRPPPIPNIINPQLLVHTDLHIDDGQHRQLDHDSEVSSPAASDVACLTPSSVDDGELQFFRSEESIVIEQESSPSFDSEEVRMELEQIARAKQILQFALDSSPHLRLFNVKRIVGYGTFGVVVEGFDLANGRKLAVKIMLKESLVNAKLYLDPVNGQPLLMEIAMLKYLPIHRNLIRYITHWQDEIFWFLVTDFHGHDWRFSQTTDDQCNPLKQDADLDPVATRPNDRSLAGLLRSFGGLNSNANSNSDSTGNQVNGPVVPEPIVKHVFKQLASSIACLHSHNITHRDLKDENVLVDENLTIHLIDFGHAGFITRGKRSYSNYGTTLFASPELRTGLQIEGPEADVYAMGLMLYEAISGDLPETVCDIKYPAYYQSCPFQMNDKNGFINSKIKDLVSWMLHPDPRKRATIKHVMEHPFFVESN